MSSFSPLNADLHCHSVISDGTLTPEQLAERAKANGVHLWALTDHDELGGQKRAREAASALKMDYLAGVEISVTWMGETIHIVGLGIDAEHAGIIEGLRCTRDGRGNRAKLMAEQLLKSGIPGAYEGALHFAGNHDLISRTHFARFLVEQGVCRNTEHVFKNYPKLPCGHDGVEAQKETAKWLLRSINPLFNEILLQSGSFLSLEEFGLLNTLAMKKYTSWK